MAGQPKTNETDETVGGVVSPREILFRWESIKVKTP